LLTRTIFEKDFYKGMEEIHSCGFNDFEMCGWWDKDLEKLMHLKSKMV
jgi:hypothetical protein